MNLPELVQKAILISAGNAGRKLSVGNLGE